MRVSDCGLQALLCLGDSINRAASLKRIASGNPVADPALSHRPQHAGSATGGPEAGGKVRPRSMTHYPGLCRIGSTQQGRIPVRVCLLC